MASEPTSASADGLRLFVMLDDDNWRPVAELFDYRNGDICMADIGWFEATTHPFHRLEGPWARAPDHPLASSGGDGRLAWVNGRGQFIAEDYPGGPQEAELDAWASRKASDARLDRSRCRQAALDAGEAVS